MQSSKDRLSYLFNSYYNKTATKQEIQELFQLFETASDDELTAVTREEWENLRIDNPLFKSDKSFEILNKILSSEKEEDILGKEAKANNEMKLPSLLNKYLAAAILIFVSVGTYLWLRPVTSEPQAKIISNVFHDALPGGNKAVLTLANGGTIILDSAQNGVIVRMANFEVNKTEDGQLVYHVVDNSAFEPVLNTISTPRGGQYRVVLPDGSKVWLNAASSIKFPSVFTGEVREVELKGEAYFEVAENATMPFKVISNQAQIEVLGTHFNVRAYDDEHIMKTTLLEGSIKISAGKLTNVLKPNDQVVLNDESGMKLFHNVDTDVEIAWKNGVFQFKDTDIKEVMQQAAMWYNLNVSFEAGVQKRYFTGKISRNVKASEFLNMLRYTGVKFRTEGKNIVVIN